MSPVTRGVLYVATGAAHLGAARASAASVRRSNPGLATAVFTDIAEPAGAFDIVLPVEGAHARSKVDCMHRSPFDETLYLDSDTRVFGPLDDLFPLLERFELAGAHVAAPHVRGYQKQWRHQVPPSFPQLNSGVLLYRGSAEVRAFLSAWRDAFHAAGFKTDQVTLRDLLWASEIRFAVLLPRYNRRRYGWAEHLFAREPRPVILHTNRYHPTKYGPLKRRLARVLYPEP